MKRLHILVFFSFLISTAAAAPAKIERFGPDQRVEITADSMYEIGKALATVQADDNFCKLAQYMAKVSGQAAHYLSDSPTNIANDIMERAQRPERAHLLQAADGPDQFEKGPTHHQDELDFLAGYVDGYNAYRKQKRQLRKRHPECAGTPIIKLEAKIEHLAHSHSINSCAASFTKNIIAAAPPGRVRKSALPPSKHDQITPKRRYASTNWMFGKETTAGVKSVLLDSPHDNYYPVFAARLKIPGKMDTFLSLYSDSPGFHGWTNGKVAGGITCGYGQVHAVYRLDLAPDKPTHYIVDGITKPLEKREVAIKVRTPAGKIEQRTHTIYRSDFGFVIGGDDYPWDNQHAFALREVNEGLPDLLLYPFHPMVYNAETAEELVDAYLRLERNESLQLSAIDHQGTVASAPNGIVINLGDAQWEDCAVFEDRGLPSDIQVLPILDGSRSACALKDADDRHAPGTMPLASIPTHVAQTALFDSNHTVARTNPRKRLTGFSRLIDGPDRRQRSTRFLAHPYLLDARSQGADGYPGTKWSVETAWSRYADGESYWASRFKGQIIKICKDARTSLQEGIKVDLREACRVLETWDGRSRAESRGYLLWSYFWKELPNAKTTGAGQQQPGIVGPGPIKDIFVDRLDLDNPYNTPSSVDTSRSYLVTDALGRTVLAFKNQGIPLKVSVTEGQSIVINGRRFALPGCQWSDGCENVQVGSQYGVIREATQEKYFGGHITAVFGLLGEGRVRVKYGGPWWGFETHPSRGIQTLSGERWAVGEGFDVELQLGE